MLELSYLKYSPLLWMTADWKIKIDHGHAELFGHIFPACFCPSMPTFGEDEGHLRRALAVIVLRLTGGTATMLPTRK